MRVFSVECTWTAFKKRLTHEVSVMTNLYKDTCAVVKDEKDDRLLPHPIRRPRLTKGRKNLKKHQETERKAPSDKKERTCKKL